MGHHSFSWPCQAVVDVISQLMSSVCVCVRDRSMGLYTSLFIRLNPLSAIDSLAVDKGFGPHQPTQGHGCHSPDGGHAKSSEQHRLS